MNIPNYQIVRHGVEYSDYFQGCGTSFTEYDHVQTGIGDTEREAFDDALDMIAQSHDIDEPSMKRLEWDGEHVEWSAEPVGESGMEDEEDNTIGACDAPEHP